MSPPHSYIDQIPSAVGLDHHKRKSDHNAGHRCAQRTLSQCQVHSLLLSSEQYDAWHGGSSSKKPCTGKTSTQLDRDSVNKELTFGSIEIGSAEQSSERKIQYEKT